MPHSENAAGVLRPGDWVALTLKADAAPLRVYVGEVQAVADPGVRITLIDWLVGTACAWDFFAPWESICSALVATPEHDVGRFGAAGADWQRAMDPAKDAAQQDGG